MELSIFIAKIIAVLYLSASAGVLLGTVDSDKLYKELTESAGNNFILGFMALILGFVVVRCHNIWVKDWTVLITIFAWAGLIKGVMLIAFPNTTKWFAPLFKKNLKIFPYIALIIGLVFGYFGFFS